MGFLKKDFLISYLNNPLTMASNIDANNHLEPALGGSTAGTPDIRKQNTDHVDNLTRYNTADSFVPMEVFEKMYLAPKERVTGHLRSTFGNPTPL